MGWFDQETKDEAAGSAPAASAPPTPRPSPAPSSGNSTVGPRVQINGTLVSDEDLEIVGKVEGTIHAHKALRVARDADVKAVIHGAEVLVEGTVHGDIHASNTLVLGATAAVTGNIKAPSLQIREGAFFRGQVSMQREKAAPAKAEAPRAVKTDSSTSAKSGAGADAKSGLGAKPEPAKSGEPAAKAANR